MIEEKAKLELHAIDGRILEKFPMARDAIEWRWWCGNLQVRGLRVLIGLVVRGKEGIGIQMNGTDD